MINAESLVQTDTPDAVTYESVPFEDAYVRYGRLVHRYCLSRLLDRAEAEEVAAQSLAQAFCAYKRTRLAPKAIRGWLLRIARNCVSDHLRRQRRNRLLVAALAHRPRVAADPEHEAVVKSELTAVLTAMRKLSHRDCELIGLRAGAELS